MWSKQDVEQYLRDTLNWTSWKVEPFIHHFGQQNEIGSVSEKNQLFVGKLNFVGYENSSLSIIPNDNIIAEPEEITAPAWSVSNGAVYKDGVKSPYGYYNAELVQCASEGGSGGMLYQSNLFLTDLRFGIHWKDMMKDGELWITVKYTDATVDQWKFNTGNEISGREIDTWQNIQMNDGWSFSQVYCAGEKSVNEITLSLRDFSFMGLYGAYLYENPDVFQNFASEGLPKPRIAHGTLVNGSPLGLDSASVVSTHLQDTTGYGYFTGYRYLRET